MPIIAIPLTYTYHELQSLKIHHHNQANKDTGDQKSLLLKHRSHIIKRLPIGSLWKHSPVLLNERKLQIRDIST